MKEIAINYEATCSLAYREEKFFVSINGVLAEINRETAKEIFMKIYYTGFLIYLDCHTLEKEVPELFTEKEAKKLYEAYEKK